MKIVVISDSHGRPDRIEEVLRRNRSYDALLFLGDGLRDFYSLESEPCCFRYVSGNCDGLSFSSDTPTELMLRLDGVSIFMTHGHGYSVKSGRESLMARGISLGADVILYGHTHVREERYIPEGTTVRGVTAEKGTYLFNPGSLGSPVGSEPSFGVIEIRNGQVLLSHGEIR